MGFLSQMTHWCWYEYLKGLTLSFLDPHHDLVLTQGPRNWVDVFLVLDATVVILYSDGTLNTHLWYAARLLRVGHLVFHHQSLRPSFD